MRQYCSRVWHFWSAINCDKLESLNKRALRIVFNDKVSSYKQLLHKSEGTTLRCLKINAGKTHKRIKSLSNNKSGSVKNVV